MNYIIYDLELNCSHKKGDISEIIEIGAVKVDQKLKVVDTFASFVRPKLYRKLSPIVKRKTRISQKQIDSAKAFLPVFKKFRAWLGDDYILCSWGRDDKRHFKINCELYKLPTEWLDRHIDIQKQYTSLCERPKNCQVGLKTALEIQGIEIAAKQHRALVDAEYTAKIFVQIFDQLSFAY